MHGKDVDDVERDVVEWADAARWNLDYYYFYTLIIETSLKYLSNSDKINFE